MNRCVVNSRQQCLQSTAGSHRSSDSDESHNVGLVTKKHGFQMCCGEHVEHTVDHAWQIVPPSEFHATFHFSLKKTRKTELSGSEWIFEHISSFHPILVQCYLESKCTDQMKSFYCCDFFSGALNATICWWHLSKFNAFIAPENHTVNRLHLASEKSEIKNFFL